MRIRLDQVGVSLGRRLVLAGVSAKLDPGTLVGVIGPNGAGKSTLARAMLGLVEHEGRVLIDGEEVAAIARPDLARRIAYLPQGQALHWPLSVERLVALGRLPHLAPFSRIGEADREAIEHAMQRADVLHLRDRVATELSGGERARALLARALAVEAPVLIADEPLASLDPGHQIDVMELLRAEADAGKLVVAVLHDLAMAARHCDHILLIDRGRLVADGSADKVLTAERLRTVYGIAASIDRRDGRPVIIASGRSRNEI